MKTLIISLFTACLVCGPLVCQANEGRAKDSGSVKNEKKAEKYLGYAKNYDKQAKAAQEAGKADLAKAYEACAAAKRIMSKAYASGDKELLKQGKEAYAKARTELAKCKKSDAKKKCAK